MKKFLQMAMILGTVPVILTSCETSPAPRDKPGAGTESAATGSATPDGRRLYFGRCTACHAPDPVHDYTGSEWHGIIAEMAPKAKLSGAERSAVLSYVLANAADS